MVLQPYHVTLPQPLHATKPNYTNPFSGTLTQNSDGSFTYQYRFGFFSPRDSFTYTISDGKGETSTATVQISFV